MKVVIGFKILMAVLQQRFALYINPVSPSKETFLVPNSTLEAPSFRSSVARIASKPNKVLAIILKFFSIDILFVTTKIQ